MTEAVSKHDFIAAALDRRKRILAPHVKKQTVQTMSLKINVYQRILSDEMTKTSQLAKDIEATEGFAVRIRVKMQGKSSYRRYQYARIARNSFTVADWRRRRFDSLYPDLTVEVLRGDGRAASPRAALSRIRQSYN